MNELDAGRTESRECQLRAASVQIVESGNRPIGMRDGEPRREVRADESRATSDEDAHEPRLLARSAAVRHVVAILVCGYRSEPAARAPRRFAGGRTEPRAQLRVAAQTLERAAKPARVDEDPGDTVFDGVNKSPDARSHDRSPVRHPFAGDDAVALPPGGHAHDRSALIVGAELVVRNEADRLRHLPTQGPVADNHTRQSLRR